ncbi:hypothetical protein [Spirosoma aerophilum]
MNKVPIVFLLLAACQSANDSHDHAPTDLVIHNSIWTRSDPNHLYHDVEVCEHDFTLINTSDQFVYDRIVVRISYYDHQHRLLQEGLHKISHPLKPKESFRVKGMSGGIVKPGTNSTSVHLVKATRQRLAVTNPYEPIHFGYQKRNTPSTPGQK